MIPILSEPGEKQQRQTQQSDTLSNGSTHFMTTFDADLNLNQIENYEHTDLATHINATRGKYIHGDKKRLVNTHTANSKHDGGGGNLTMTRDAYFSSQSNKLELIENNTNTNSKQLKNDDGFDDEDVDVDDEYDEDDRMDESDDVDDQTYDVLGMDQEKPNA